MTFQYTTAVDFADTDAGGVVYHSRYLDMAERARSAWLRSMGTSNSVLQGQGYLFVVRDLAVQYRQPAKLDDELVITVDVERIKGASLYLKQGIYCSERLLVSLDIKLACLNGDGRPTRIPAFLIKTCSDTPAPL